MSLIDRWRHKISHHQAADVGVELQTGIRTSGPKTWVSPADIERLEEQKVPWLAEKRRRAAAQARKGP